jgi:hypothetical protein
MDNNGWAGRPGVPPKPQFRGWHWLYLYNGIPVPAYWDGYWLINGNRIQVADLNPQIKYWGECLTPAEVEARIAAAHKDALAEAARRLEELHKNHKYKPETGEGSEHDTGYYRAIAEGVAHIRALAKEEGNE